MGWGAPVCGEWGCACAPVGIAWAAHVAPCSHPAVHAALRCAAVPGDNSIDLLTNDLGLVVIMNDAGELEGFDVYVGGGMGRWGRVGGWGFQLWRRRGQVGKCDGGVSVGHGQWHGQVGGWVPECVGGWGGWSLGLTCVVGKEGEYCRCRRTTLHPMPPTPAALCAGLTVSPPPSRAWPTRWALCPPTMCSTWSRRWWPRSATMAAATCATR